MISIMSTVLFLLWSIIFDTIWSLECVTVVGSQSGSSDGDLSIAACPMNFIIISCGIKIEPNSDTSRQYFQQTHGTFIHPNNTCTSTNVAPMTGVTVYARCCNLLSYNAIINTYESPPSEPKSGVIQNARYDDIETSIACNTDETLIGCTTYSYQGTRIDGGYPGIDIAGDRFNGDGETLFNETTCSSQGGWKMNYGVYAKAICVKDDPSFTMDCRSIRAESTSGPNSGTWSNVTCPITHPVMTSCQAISYDKNWDIVFIDDNNGCNTRKIDEKELAAIALWYVYYPIFP